MLPIGTRVALGNINDLTTPTLLINNSYKLGDVVAIEDTDKTAQKLYMYVKSHTGLTAYQPYVLKISSTSGAEIITGAPATMAAPGMVVCVPQVAFTSGYYGFVLIQGDGKVLMKAETYAAGDMLQVIDTDTKLVVDGTSGATVFSVNTCAVCKESGSTAVARNMYLFNRQAVVAAS